MIHADKARELTQAHLSKIDKDVPYYAEDVLTHINMIISNESSQFYCTIRKDLNSYTTKKIPEPIKVKVLKYLIKVLEDNFDYLVYDDLDDPKNFFIIKWQ